MNTPNNKKIINWDKKNIDDENRFDQRSKQHTSDLSDKETSSSQLDSFYQNQLDTDQPLLKLRKDDDMDIKDEEPEIFFDISLIDDEKENEETKRIVEQQNQTTRLGINMEQAIKNKPFYETETCPQSDSVASRLTGIKNSPLEDDDEPQNLAELILKKSGIKAPKKKKS